MCWENTYPMIYSRSFFTYPSKHHVHINRPPRKVKIIYIRYSSLPIYIYVLGFRGTRACSLYDKVCYDYAACAWSIPDRPPCLPKYTRVSLVVEKGRTDAHKEMRLMRRRTIAENQPRAGITT